MTSKALCISLFILFATVASQEYSESGPSNYLLDGFGIGGGLNGHIGGQIGGFGGGINGGISGGIGGHIGWPGFFGGQWSPGTGTPVSSNFQLDENQMGEINRMVPWLQNPGGQLGSLSPGFPNLPAQWPNLQIDENQIRKIVGLFPWLKNPSGQQWLESSILPNFPAVSPGQLPSGGVPWGQPWPLWPGSPITINFPVVLPGQLPQPCDVPSEEHQRPKSPSKKPSIMESVIKRLPFYIFEKPIRVHHRRRYDEEVRLTQDENSNSFANGSDEDDSNEDGPNEDDSDQDSSDDSDGSPVDSDFASYNSQMYDIKPSDMNAAMPADQSAPDSLPPPAAAVAARVSATRSEQAGNEQAARKAYELYKSAQRQYH